MRRLFRKTPSVKEIRKQKRKQNTQPLSFTGSIIQVTLDYLTSLGVPTTNLEEPVSIRLINDNEFVIIGKEN